MKQPPGPPAAPLEHTAGEEVGPDRMHIDGDHPDGVIRVERDDRAHGVRMRGQPLGIEDERRPERHVRDRDERGALVDRRVEGVLVECDPVGTRDHDDARAQLGGERLDGVADAREVERGHDDGVAARAEVHRREDRGLREGDGRGHRHLMWGRAEEGGDHIAHGQRGRPPLLRPGLDPPCIPELGVARELGGDRLRHRPQGVGDEVGAPREDREGLAEAKEGIGHTTNLSVAARPSSQRVRAR